MSERMREALRRIRRWLCGPVMRCATSAASLTNTNQVRHTDYAGNDAGLSYAALTAVSG